MVPRSFSIHALHVVATAIGPYSAAIIEFVDPRFQAMICLKFIGNGAVCRSLGTQAASRHCVVPHASAWAPGSGSSAARPDCLSVGCLAQPSGVLAANPKSFRYGWWLTRRGSKPYEVNNDDHELFESLPGPGVVGHGP